MTTPIGYAVLQLIPSLDGVSAAVDKQLGGTLKAAGKKGGRDFGRAAADGIKAGEADVKRALDGYSKLYDKQADSAGKLKVAKAALADLDKKGIDSGARYARAVEAQEKAQRDHNRTLRDAQGAFADYEKAAKDAAKAADDVVGGSSGGGLFSKLKNLAGGAKSSGGEAASGFVEGFGGPIAELGSKAGPIGLGLAAAAAVALSAGALIGKNVMAGLENEAKADEIQARFGLDKATIAQFGAAGGKAYAQNFGESITGNIEAAAVALQNGLLPVGATEKDTQAVVESLSTVSSVLGVDIPEAARSAGQLIKTGFATDFKSAADLIVSGSQSGLNISGDWLDTVNEYSTQFRKLGLSGPEAMGLLSQAVKNGARDTDVAADALKEFNIRAIDGSKATGAAFFNLGYGNEQQLKLMDALAAGGVPAHDALGKILGDIRNLKDPLIQSQVAVGLFGTQAEDLGSAFQHFDLSTAVQQLGQVDGAAQRASDTLGGNTASSIESAKRSIEVAATGAQTALADAFGPQLQQIADWVIAHQDDITSFFQTAADAGVQFGAAIGTMVGGVVLSLGLIGAAVGDMVGFTLDGFESIAGAAATVAEAVGADGVAGKLRAAQTQLGQWSEDAHGYGEGLKKTGQDILDSSTAFANGTQTVTEKAAASVKAAHDQVEGVRAALAALPNGKNIDITAIVTFKDPTGVVIPADQLRAPRNYIPATPGESGRPRGGGRAGGGDITGPGGPTSDIIPIWASNGEHMLDAQDVDLMGGQSGVYAFRSALKAGTVRGHSTGGAIGPDVAAAQALAGTPYSQGNRTDCSGMPARVIARALGLPESGLMSTKNAAEWLTAAGFQPGTGGPGQISVGWYDHGPNPNDGHMAMTLSDGTNAEAGGKNNVFTLGAGAAGANSPQFDQHMFLPTLFGEGQAGGFSGFAGSSGGIVGGGVAGVGPNGESGTYAAPDAKAVREADQKVADADTRVREAEAKQRELAADAKDSQRISAQADVDKAKREATDARADAEEAKRGKFSPGKGGDGGGGTPLGLKLPSAFSGLASIGLDGLGFTTQASPNSPARTFDFGTALGAGVAGQVSSALDVFGVGDSPPFLQAASKLIGGISIGGGGSSVAPLSATSPLGGTPPPDVGDAHGLRAGQAPGPPGDTYNIQTARVEDAFLQSERIKNEKRLAQVSRY